MERSDAAHAWKRAREHQEAGDSEREEQIYRQILEAEPTNIEGHFRLGVLLQKQDRRKQAEPCFRQVLTLDPDHVAACIELSHLLLQENKSTEAEAYCRRAILAAPDRVHAHHNLGVALQQQGRLEEAVECYYHAIVLNPDIAGAGSNSDKQLVAQSYNNLGIALKTLGQLDAAIDCFNRGLALSPNFPQLHFNLGNALRDRGRFNEAIASYQRALELNPCYADALLNLGYLLHLAEDRPDEALEAYDRALQLKPDFAEAHLNRGNVLKDQSRVAEALDAYDRALQVKPDLAEAQLNRGSVLAGQARFTEALDAYQEALRVRPNWGDAYSNYLFCLNYDPAQDDAALAEAHRLWGERHAPWPEAFTTYPNSRDPDKPLRVGLMSADFGRHPVGFFLDRVLAAATSGAQYICYAERPRRREDKLTDRLRAHACAWRPTIGVPDRQLAELIRADGIDILTDLAGHTAGNRLGCFRFRPAPVQVHWAGYCHSIPLMDYSIWDPIQLPVSQERWFVERIVRLPDVRWCYAAPDYAPAVSDPPVLQRGYVTFGSFNTLAKINSAVIDLWLRVLEAVPRSRLLLSWPTLGDPNERARLASAFSERGLDLCRLELRQGAREHAGVLGEYSEVDIALDPFPFSGCLTTCEALWMGLPVVTWPHSRPVSRQSQAFLTAIGRTEWVARDAADYVQIAASLAADSDRLVALRREQRARMAASPLCDGPRFARNLEEIYRTIWRTFTAGAAPLPTVSNLLGEASRMPRNNKAKYPMQSLPE